MGVESRNKMLNMLNFKWWHFENEIILLNVRWCLTDLKQPAQNYKKLYTQEIIC